ncbi:MAG: isoprenylcysteine carboxylmethyltransferase family protein [Chloroflexota bacterium]|nr:isoprenylcysteine carboxylmethyltransferase family protein [Chloroflexota bacterium]
MKVNSASKESMLQPETRWGVIRWLIRETFGVVFVAVTLFWPAGRLDWTMGWALVALYAVWVVAQAILLIPKNPQLLVERATRRKEAKGWDLVLLSIIGVVTIAKHAVAGLDIRYGWKPEIALGFQVVALLMAAGGYALETWAMTANPFFSMVVRMQEDRGHAVATGGPYRYVRHPGYTGTTLFELASPVALGSPWALIPSVLVIALTVIRTIREDETLKEELGGYEAYIQDVPYRLVPGVW